MRTLALAMLEIASLFAQPILRLELGKIGVRTLTLLRDFGSHDDVRADFDRSDFDRCRWGGRGLRGEIPSEDRHRSLLNLRGRQNARDLPSESGGDRLDIRPTPLGRLLKDSGAGGGRVLEVVLQVANVIGSRSRGGVNHLAYLRQIVESDLHAIGRVIAVNRRLAARLRIPIIRLHRITGCFQIFSRTEHPGYIGETSIRLLCVLRCRRRGRRSLRHDANFDEGLVGLFLNSRFADCFDVWFTQGVDDGVRVASVRLGREHPSRGYEDNDG